MSIAAERELGGLKTLVRKARPVNVEQVTEIVNTYFEMTKWSLLKDEWVKMTDNQKHDLNVMIFNER